MSKQKLSATLLEDLRFFIGAFFLLIGSILTFTGLATPTLVEGFNLNLITGVSFLVFAAAALALAISHASKR